MSQLLILQTALLNFLQEQVLPRLMQRKAPAKDRLRIWSIGCSAGDEASTLALLVRSLLPADWPEKQMIIFATDTDKTALASARDYYYPVQLLSHLPEQSLPFLQAGPTGYSLLSSLRRQILFGQHLLLSQLPFPQLDLILWHGSCADYTAGQQQLLFNRFAATLNPKGYLLLASPVVNDPDTEYYQRVEGVWPLYQRNAMPVEIPSFVRVKAQQQSDASSSSQHTLNERDKPMPDLVEELQVALEDREQALKEANRHLQTLDQAYRDLEQAQLHREDYISMIAHEIRSPLTTLLLTTQFLKRACSEQEQTAENSVAFQQRLVKDLETIERMGQQISQHAIDLLARAKLHSELFYLSRHPIDLVKLVRNIIKQQELATNRRIRLIAPFEHMVGKWDEMRLEQLVGNLLSNALKYSDSPTEVVITLGYRFRSGQGQQVLIMVQDQGLGISQENLQHIFDRYYRANKQRDDASASKSLGLGLYICTEIVNRHGGHIWAESSPGRGSTFFVALPLVEPEMRILPDVATIPAIEEVSTSMHS